MTVKELMKILKKLPKDFDVAIEADDGSIYQICEDTDVIEVNFIEENSLKHLVNRNILVLRPCKFEEEKLDEVDINWN